ncbi:hypothetical protein ES703_122603 [subsurface metagenome]
MSKKSRLFNWSAAHRVAQAVWQDSPKTILDVEKMTATVLLYSHAPRNALRREPVWYQSHYEMMNQMCLLTALMLEGAADLYKVLAGHGLSVILESAFGRLPAETRNFLRRIVWR